PPPAGRRRGGRRGPPAGVRGRLTRTLCRAGGSRGAGPRQFFAGVAILLGPDGSFEVAVAGHPPMLRVDARGAVVEKFGRGAYPVGIKEAQAWAVETGAVAPGESLVLHSDGLPEARNVLGQEFGDERIVAALARTAGRGAAEIVAALSGEVLSFLGRTPIGDDVSIAVLKRRSS
ncbi:MAG TPA: PP2C family protein-serine/threonine phosphatase, partial [Thermoanaerobaculia bacterium]|nr:PP2C family protein-serine/threonine phosphatase [Thermoanaerobaculia bacterium]